MINKLLAENTIIILSGEGIHGTFELYKGKRTELAINRRLAKERCNANRWAKAFVYLHESEGGSVYMDLHSGDIRNINEEDLR